MSAGVRSNPWPLVAVVLGLVLAFDLGARTRAPVAFLGGTPDQISIQVDVEGPAQMVYQVPVDRTFVLKDLLVANTQANKKKVLNVGDDIYPTLANGFGDGAEVKIAGSNLMDWAKGNNNSSFGGGRSGKKGNTRAQSGLVGLTGGVVFEPGTMVVVRDYTGPLYLDGLLLPSS